MNNAAYTQVQSNVTSNHTAVIHADRISKTYQQGQLSVTVLREVCLTVRQADTVAILGASGSGKSTLLHLLGGLDDPSSGAVCVLGQPFVGMSATARGKLRNQSLGFVYQFHHLLPEFTALENVAMPLLIRGVKRKAAEEKAMTMLDAVGLARRVQHKPGELSGGERQRVALARALVTEPACLLADEPTGNLDRQTADQVFELMLSLNARCGTALVLVTHDAALAARCQSRYVMVDGVLRVEGAE